MWKVEPVWRGETVWIIAGGTSVRSQDLSRLRGERVIVVNSSYEAFPNADLLFFSDSRWFDVHRGKLAAFKGIIATCHSSVGLPQKPNYRRLNRLYPSAPGRGKPAVGFAEEPDAVCCARTSTQGAINLAVHLGATRIILLGADMQRAPDGGTHHHSAHKWRNKPGNRTWDSQIEQLGWAVDALAARNIEVLNASPYSRLPHWPMVAYESLLVKPRPAGMVSPMYRCSQEIDPNDPQTEWPRDGAFVFVGVGGNLCVQPVDDPDETKTLFCNLPGSCGYILPVKVAKVWPAADGTTAQNLTLVW